MNGTVTTIIPTFRRPQLLRRAIRSALAQEYGDVKVCVYDNASGDETAAVVAAIAAVDERVTYYCQERHLDVTENFLYGMERVATPYFSFLSDDDVLFPKFYATAVDKLAQHPDALFAAGSVIEFDQTGSVRYAPLALWDRDGRFSPPEGFFAMLDNRHPTWTGIVFRREAIARAGKLDPQVGGPIDLDYELRIAARYPYVIFYEPSAGYVVHGDSVSAGENANVIAGYQRIDQKLRADGALDASLRARIHESLQHQMQRKLHEIAFKAVASGNQDDAHAAAGLLRTSFGDPITALGVELAAIASGSLMPLRKLFATLELTRLRRRAAVARDRLRASTGDDGSAYARFLQIEGGDGTQ